MSSSSSAIPKWIYVVLPIVLLLFIISFVVVMLIMKKDDLKPIVLTTPEGLYVKIVDAAQPNVVIPSEQDLDSWMLREKEFWCSILPEKCILISSCMKRYKTMIVPCFESSCLMQTYAAYKARAVTDLSTISVAAQRDLTTFGALIGHEWLHAGFYCMGFVEPWGKDTCGNAIDMHHWFGWVLGHRSMQGPAPVKAECIDVNWTQGKNELILKLNTMTVR